MYNLVKTSLHERFVSYMIFSIKNSNVFNSVNTRLLNYL
jgi:hypothetical protein